MSTVLTRLGTESRSSILRPEFPDVYGLQFRSFPDCDPSVLSPDH